MVNILRMLIMGPPGSGKGTISSRIIRDFGFSYLPCGDLLRSHIHDKTPEGNTAKAYIDKGEFVPDNLVTDLVFKELHRLEGKHILIDGFPRTVKQADSLSEKIQVDSVIDLKVPDDAIIHRLQSRWLHLPSGRVYNTEFNPPKVPGKDDVTGETLIQRSDDMPETVKKRLENYKTVTKPLQTYYRNKNLLHEFTGKDSNEIWNYVKKYLEDLMKRK